MNSKIIPTAVLAFFAAAALTNPPRLHAEEKPASPLKVMLSTIPGAEITGQDFPLRITLKNTGPRRLRLLYKFSPLDVFFDFDVKREGKEVPTPRVALADFRTEDERYIKLGSGESFDFKVNLLDVIRDGISPGHSLIAGEYRINAVYHNAYGKDCFRGPTEKSNEVVVHVPQTLKLED
ncbi:hypothetical protein EON80_16360 [bacterium]|nr:MAG: hypothetical protein EON80_16360 [bacterium]